jgi:hypothetical protein
MEIKRHGLFPFVVNEKDKKIISVNIAISEFDITYVFLDTWIKAEVPYIL